MGRWNAGAWSQESPTSGKGEDWKVGSKGPQEGEPPSNVDRQSKGIQKVPNTFLFRSCRRTRNLTALYVKPALVSSPPPISSLLPFVSLLSVWILPSAGINSWEVCYLRGLRGRGASS